MVSVVATEVDPWSAHTEDLADLVPTLSPQVDAPNVAKPGYPLTIRYEPNVSGGALDVRRPLSGIAVKPNTHAFITIVNADGSKAQVFNDLGSLSRPSGPLATPGGRNFTPTGAGAPTSPYWTDWLLQSVEEIRQEKFQIVETFGEPILYVFGERPRLLQVSGYLMNTADFNWRAQFWENWERFFRATKLVEYNRRMYLGFDDILVSGYPLNAQARDHANDPNKIMFSFSFLITGYSNFGMNGIGQPSQAGAGANPSPTAARFNEFLRSGSFADPAYELARSQDGALAQVIGGDRLKALQSIQELRDSLEIAGFSFFDMVNSPDLRYIKDSKTAMEVLLAHSRRIANTLAYQGVEELAAQTAGGTLGLNFWFGLVAQLYRVVFVNGLRMLGVRNSTEENRWLNLIDYTATLGNPYAVASTLSYTATSQLTVALESSTNKYELSNVRYDFKRGLVARGQDSAYGEALSYRNSAVATSDRDAVTSRALSIPDSATREVSSAGGGSSGYAQPQGEQGVATAADAGTVPDQLLANDAERELVEREAVEAQNAQRTTNHGALNVVEDPDEVEDDGSF